MAKDAHGRHLPASTLKTLTVLTTLTTQPQVDPHEIVVADRADLVDGSKVGLDPGSHYTVEQLLQGTMLASGNDTATALARVAGGVPQTVARMQAEADRLGARDTTVRNPSGLDAPGQVTSAYDLALVARAAMQLPAFRTLVTTKRVRFPGKEVKGKARTSFQIQNHNRLLYNYAGTIGVKDGYTVAARWTAISAVERGGHRYLFTAHAPRRAELAHPGGDVRLGVPLRRAGAAGRAAGRPRRARPQRSTVTGEPAVAAAARPPAAALQASPRQRRHAEARRRRWGGRGAARGACSSRSARGPSAVSWPSARARRRGRPRAPLRPGVAQRPRADATSACSAATHGVTDDACCQAEHGTSRDRGAVGRARRRTTAARRRADPPGCGSGRRRLARQVTALGGRRGGPRGREQHDPADEVHEHEQADDDREAGQQRLAARTGQQQPAGQFQDAETRPRPRARPARGRPAGARCRS